jgi:hypothetical protein
MTPKTPQGEVFWALLLSSEHSGVPEDSHSRLFQVLGFTRTLGQSRGATLPLAIELGFSFTSFLLLFKRANLDHLGSLLEKIIFYSNLEKHLFSQPSLIGKEWLLLVDGREGEYNGHL